MQAIDWKSLNGPSSEDLADIPLLLEELMGSPGDPTKREALLLKGWKQGTIYHVTPFIAQAILDRLAEPGSNNHTAGLWILRQFACGQPYEQEASDSDGVVVRQLETIEPNWAATIRSQINDRRNLLLNLLSQSDQRETRRECASLLAFCQSVHGAELERYAQLLKLDADSLVQAILILSGAALQIPGVIGFAKSFIESSRSKTIRLASAIALAYSHNTDQYSEEATIKILKKCIDNPFDYEQLHSSFCWSTFGDLPLSDEIAFNACLFLSEIHNNESARMAFRVLAKTLDTIDDRDDGLREIEVIYAMLRLGFTKGVATQPLSKLQVSVINCIINCNQIWDLRINSGIDKVLANINLPTNKLDLSSLII